MAEPKWTPGPWAIETPMGDEPWIVEAGKASHEWHCLALVPEDEDLPGIEKEANARLISTAPELYLALNALLGWHESDPTSLGALCAANHARQVLAKAKGEHNG